MSLDPRPSAIAIMGPTASGKTAFALEVAERFNGEIVSVDSALVYRGLDIGAAKPSADERARVPHHLLDVRDPWQVYSAADFAHDARRAMDDIAARGRLPVLAGGTGLYFQALLEGLAAMPPADAALRDRITARAQQAGWPALHAELARIDPESAARIHPNDPQRLVRALEVYRVSGSTMSEHRARQRSQKAVADAPGSGVLPYTVAHLCIAPAQRSILHERIERRFLGMVEQGFIEEVEALRCRGDLHPGMPSIRSVGYRQVWEYLDGRSSRDEMVERGIVATRQLAKRQFTWLRSWGESYWLDSLSRDNLPHALKYLQSLSILS